MKPVLSIQYLRALAAVSVVLSHCWSGSVVPQAGVDVFFVISGFIMWTITSSTAHTLHPIKFLWARLSRVGPLYWVATLVMAAHQHAAMGDIAASLAFWPYFGESGKIWPVLVQGWTIDYEMMFYALMSMTLLISRELALIALSVCLLALSLLHTTIVGTLHNAPLDAYTNPIILEFLSGIVLAELRLRRWMPHSAVGMALCGIGVVVFWATAPVELPDGWERCILWGIPAFLIVAGCVIVETRLGMIEARGLRLLGDASYSLYLTHTFVVRTVLRWLDHTSPVLSIMSAMLIATSTGLLVHLILERRLNTSLHRFGYLASRRLFLCGKMPNIT